jgi:hypothetical protein
VKPMVVLSFLAGPLEWARETTPPARSRPSAG